jgi:Sulfotransferase domain
MKHHLYKDLPENGRKSYGEGNAEIQQIVPKDKLWVINVEDWEPLRVFIREDVPGWELEG